MGQFILSCCSTVDMKKEYFEERNIPYACFHYRMDGRDYPDDLGQTMSLEEFYNRMEIAMPVTSQVNSEELIEMFEPYLKDGKDILHVSLSSGISGAFNSANIAKEELQAKYPDRKIMIVDSLGASSGYGMLVDYLADMRDAGKSIEETRQWAEENKLNIHHWIFSTDLTSYKRGGRITGTEAMLGTMLGICPILNMNHLGGLIPKKKIRTKRKAIEEIVKMMEQYVKDGKDYNEKCFISNSACYDDAVKVAGLIEDRFPQIKGKIIMNSIGTVIGSHTGPGTVALFFVGKRRVD